MKLSLFKGILIFLLITFGMLTFSSYVQAKDYEYKDLNITADILND
jgi:hypothetical protein